MRGVIGRPPAVTTVALELSAEQARDFAACADACGLILERWIVECAAVKAADVIDAVQATDRRRRAAELADNEPTNARNRARRARVRKTPPLPPQESETLQAARALNERFRTRAKP
jgi:hypothetical protein